MAHSSGSIMQFRPATKSAEALIARGATPRTMFTDDSRSRAGPLQRDYLQEIPRGCPHVYALHLIVPRATCARTYVYPILLHGDRIIQREQSLAFRLQYCEVSGSFDYYAFSVFRYLLQTDYFIIYNKFRFVAFNFYLMR